VGSFQNTVAKWTFQQLRQDGDDVDTHGANIIQ